MPKSQDAPSAIASRFWGKKWGKNSHRLQPIPT